MEGLDTLQSLGISMPTPAYLFGAIVFGLIGVGVFRHGRRQERPVLKWIGVGLMLYPYAVSQTWLLYAIGVALCVALWFAP
jgi:hypothetical protein